MLILIVFLSVCTLAQNHLIISVTTSNSEVNANDLIAIKILTNTTIPSNSLMINFTNDFTLINPCLVNGTVSSCSYSTSTSAAIIVFGTSFATNTYYVLTATVTNPNFATNFPISASVGGTSFTNNGIVTITAKTINCSMSLSSLYVGDTSIGYFTLINDALPTNSTITMNSSLQTSFNNLFQSNPSCGFGSVNASCTLSSSFGSQYLTISNVPTNSNLTLNVSFVNNAPFNSSLISIDLIIQNANSYKMQICSFQQATPTLLRNSSSATLQNWNSKVGGTSNVTVVLSTYFTPFATNLLFIYDSNFSINAISPTQTSSATYQGKNTYNFLSNGAAVGKSLSFTLTFNNPTTQQPVNFIFYVVYSNTQFIEIYQMSVNLTTLALGISLVLSDNHAMNTSVYNCSFAMPYALVGGGTISIGLNFGTISCLSLGMTQNSALTVVNCTSSQLFLAGTSLNTGLLWVAFNVMNYYSVRNDISFSVGVAGPSPSLYALGSGSTSVVLASNNQSFLVVNSNTTFGSPTIFKITQSSVNISTSITRVFNIAVPSDLQLSAITNVLSTNSTTTIVSSYNVNISTKTITVIVQGLLNIQIGNVVNPIKYLGLTLWNFTATDSSGNPSSFSQSTQSPFYTASTPVVSVSLSNTVIEGNSPMTLTVIPALQYYFTPNVTVTIPNSFVLSCPNCTILASNIFTFTYFSTIMKITVNVKNSNNPNNNTITVVIATTNITFQSTTISYILDPMTYGYVASQSGFFGQIGVVNITITNAPSSSLNLTYSSLAQMLSGATCNGCNNTQIIASGIVQYFQTATVNLTGFANGIVYATAVAKISYICSSIQGCRICSTQNGVLVCQQCFNSTYTSFYLLYNSQCYQNCPIATYSTTFTCVACPTNCQSCNSSACLLCSINYYIYNSTCVSSCPFPLVNNATHCLQVPIICPSNCASCKSSTQCSACDGGYILLNNICYSTCPTSYILNATGDGCILFIPPDQTKYFPFGFIISAALLLIALMAIKCYEKRSLIMGNLIAFLAVVQIGSMIMTVVYTFQQNIDLLTQALLFILILSKILLNLVFLAYFVKVIASEQDFQRWRQQQEAHQRLYKALIFLSSILSFQTIRLLYSRLMGLRLFFGKFNTALIFKPLNYFTLAHFLTCGLALVVLSVRNIVSAHGYRTSTFYSSVQSIILEALLLICCIIDRKKGYDDEFFQYQVYKVKNQYEGSHIQPIQIQEQAQNVGSMHEMLNAVQSPNKGFKSKQIIRNNMWVPKVHQPSFQDIQIQSELVEEVSDKKEEQEGMKENQEGKVENKKDNLNQELKKQSLFRKKIIDDWRQLEKTLPHHMSFLKRKATKVSRKAKNQGKGWLSPQSRKQVQASLKRSSSYQKIQVRLPEHPGTIPEKIKQHFYQITSLPKLTQQQELPKASRNERKRKQRIYNKQQRLMQSERMIESEVIEPRSMTMEAELDPNEQSYSSENNQNIAKDEELSYKQKTKVGTSVGVGKYSFQAKNVTNKPNISQLEQHFQQQEQNFQDQDSDQLQEELKGNQSEKRFIQKQQPLLNENGEKDVHFQSNPKLKRKIPIKVEIQDGKDIKSKQYRTKKRRVNRQTEQVYLQRLVGSSQRKVRPLKNLKIDF